MKTEYAANFAMLRVLIKWHSMKKLLENVMLTPKTKHIKVWMEAIENNFI